MPLVFLTPSHTHLTTPGHPTLDNVCGSDDEYASDEACQQAKAQIAGIAIAFGLTAIALVTALFQTFCGGGSRRGYYLLSCLCLFASMASAVSMGVFEWRSHDEDTGWADEYGCAETEIVSISPAVRIVGPPKLTHVPLTMQSFLGDLTGRSCFLRGPGYYCLAISVFISFILSVCLSSSGRTEGRREAMLVDVPVYSYATGRGDIKQGETMYVSMA